MAKEIGDIANFRAISRRLKAYDFLLEELDEDFEDVVFGLYGPSVGKELLELFRLAADNEFVEYVAEKAIDGLNK